MPSARGNQTAQREGSPSRLAESVVSGNLHKYLLSKQRLNRKRRHAPERSVDGDECEGGRYRVREHEVNGALLERR